MCALHRKMLLADPFEQFENWFSEARLGGVPEPEAMALATCSAEGVPSSRMVLLRGFDHRGCVFFTNYGSRKAAELEANPRAALLFYWREQSRQVRIGGRVEKAGQEESEAYFQTRPRGSRLGAWASAQSSPLAERAELDEALRQAERRFPVEVPLPPFWGGYRLAPEEFEFWQAGRDRLHDRFRYRRASNTWKIERLAP